jgi:glycogen synthase
LCGIQGTGRHCTRFKRGPQRGSGFVFHEYSAEGLVKAVKAAVNAFGQGSLDKSCPQDQHTGFSWQSSARRYEKVYEKALEIKQCK